MKYKALFAAVLITGAFAAGYIRLKKTHPGFLARIERMIGLHPSRQYGVKALRNATLEDPAERSRLPEYQEVAGAKTEDLTPALPDTGQHIDWTRSQGDSASTRYSALTQINPGNVARLEVAWTYHSNDGNANIQCNPVIANGVMYVPTAGNYMVAVNAETGTELWRFKPEGRPAQRGLVYWPGNAGSGPRLFFTSGDFLYALDAKTGQPVDCFGSKGKVPFGGVVAPVIYKDALVAANWNVISGFELDSGKKIWSFDVVGKPQKGEEDIERGGNVWGGMALDAQRGIVYASTGSPHPNFLGFDHVGENKYANSVIALEAKTGRLRWSFQEIRHDIWDLDIPTPPNLVTVTHDGKRVDAVAAVTKLGNTLLLDRLTGQALFPYRLRRAPVSKLPGERTWPYQPVFDRPAPFARQWFTEADMTNLSPEARAYVSRQLASANTGFFQPFEPGKPTAYFNVHGGAQWTGAAFDPTSGWLYVSANELPWIITVIRTRTDAERDSTGELVFRQYCAGCHGLDRRGKGMAPSLLALGNRMFAEGVIDILKHGRNAMPPIPVPPDKRQKLLDFLFDIDMPKETGAPGKTVEYTYVPNGYPKLLDDQGYPGCKPPWGTLNAIDLNTGKIAWKVPLGEYDELTKRGIPKTGTENFGGASVTAGGVVFCAGTRDLKIRAFDKKNGRELWSSKLPFGGFATPSVYQVNGREFVVIPATGGGKLGSKAGDAFVAFALPK